MSLDSTTAIAAALFSVLLLGGCAPAAPPPAPTTAAAAAAVPTLTAQPSATPLPSPTPRPPTATAVPPTPSPVPPTATVPPSPTATASPTVLVLDITPPELATLTPGEQAVQRVAASQALTKAELDARANAIWHAEQDTLKNLNIAPPAATAERRHAIMSVAAFRGYANDSLVAAYRLQQTLAPSESMQWDAVQHGDLWLVSATISGPNLPRPVILSWVVPLRGSVCTVPANADGNAAALTPDFPTC